MLDTTLRRAALALTAAAGIGCVPLPDLVVTLVAGPDTAIWPSDPVPVSAEVCNQGVFATGESHVLLALHAVGIPGEVPLDVAWLPPLAPGACHGIETAAPAPWGLPDGAYVLVARADPDGTVIEPKYNNARASAPFGIGYGPDLRVEGVHGPPSAGIGDPVDVEAQICNRGTGPSPPSQVNVYVSDDASIEGGFAAPPPPESDDFAGSLPVPYLPPDTCMSVQGPVTVQAPAEGEYLLGGFVDEPDGVLELVETNNAAAGDPIGLGNAPDLVVASLAGPATAAPGSPIDVPFEVCNQGQLSSPPTSLALYLSEDAEITPSIPDPASGDWPLAWIPLPPLVPGACHGDTASTWADAPGQGAFHLGAIVDEDDSVAELRESNNARSAGPMGIGGGPDLVARVLSAPYSIENGASFDTLVELCNQGTDPSSPAPVWLSLSADTVLEPLPEGPDPDVGGAPFPPLVPGECAEQTVEALAFAPEDGPYHLIARADPNDDVPELLEGNNVTVGPLLGVGSAPDLVVTGLSAPPSAEASAPFDATATVCNRGTVPSGPTQVDFFHSADPVIQTGLPGPPSDPFAGSLPAPPLAPGQCAPAAGALYASVYEDGAYYLGAVVDPSETLQELNEDNNAFTGALMGVGHGSDLVVAELGGPPSLPSGDLSEISYTVCNQGTDGSAPSFVHLYLSDDTEIENVVEDPWASDSLLGDGSIPPLAGGACHAGSGLFYVPYLEGALYLGAIADPFGSVDELIETNNTLAVGPVGVGHGPDLVVDLVSAPPSAFPGDPIPVDVDVCNQGTEPAGPSNVTLYLSEDQEITGAFHGPSPDLPLDAFPVPPLPPGDCAPASGTVWVFAPFDGPWTLGAFVDEELSVVELVETNNTAAGPLLAVGADPDLVVTALSGPPAATQGASFGVDVTVCNLGTLPSPAAMAVLYHTPDETIETWASGSPFPDAFLVDVPLPPLAPGVCHAESKTVTAYPPAEGPGYLAATVDETDAVAEIVESNNALLGPAMEITPGP